MNTATQNARICPACRQAPLAEATRDKQFRPLGKTVTVTLRVSRCPACGAELINAEQRCENLQRLKARKAEYGHLLMGEEIVALRKKYGLTQKVAARVFGKGLIAFSRYENEASYPDISVTKLLKQAIARPEVLKSLADEEGVEIPLWEARCEDERREKLVRVMCRTDIQEHMQSRQKAFLNLLAHSATPLQQRPGAFEVTLSPKHAAMPARNEDLAAGAMAA